MSPVETKSDGGLAGEGRSWVGEQNSQMSREKMRKLPFSMSFQEGCHSLTDVLRFLVAEWSLEPGVGEAVQSPRGS